MDAKAVIFPDRLKVEFRDVSVPLPKPTDVVVRTRFSWISNGTEGSFLRGERINGETPYRPGDPWPFPIAAGYQSVGIVEKVGSDVQGVREGQWVFCTIGHILGMYEPWGGHISPKIVDQSQIWTLPEGLSPIIFSGLVLTQVGYNCGARPSVNSGDAALVLGDGMVGHWAAQTLAWRGARVLLAGKHDDRLARFPLDGTHAHINIACEPLLDAVRRLAPDGVDIVVDTVGTIDTVVSCFPLMRYNGHVVSAGFNGANSMIDIQKLRFGELTFHSPSGWTKERMDATLELVANGHLKTEPLITHRFPVEKAADAWNLILNKIEPVLGVVLTWE